MMPARRRFGKFMDAYLVWLAAGFVLVIAELVSGTFYLLILGIAAFIGSAAAWFGLGRWLQVLIAAAGAIGGMVWVHRQRKSNPQASMKSLDIGQAVTLDSWISQEQGVARVRYRDALWDAQVEGERAFAAGQILFIHDVAGSTLKVAGTKPV
jgi:membrane protein implicated in regulation of membrane protease activity